VKPLFFLFSAVFVLTGAGCTSSALSSTTSPETQDSFISPVVAQTHWTFPGVLPAEQIQNKQIRLVTDKGEIVFKLYSDTAPKTVSNFVYLASAGYFDGLTFHRREEGFVIQGGDPNGNGTGGPGYKFEDELNDDRTYVRGTVAMANAGPNTNGSQFFIMLDNVPLPHAYTIFGEVTVGMDVVDQIKRGDAMTKVTVEDVR
jgi:cyclophilin family peptidyl-prolyl cis-trans isomerase